MRPDGRSKARLLEPNRLKPSAPLVSISWKRSKHHGASLYARKRRMNAVHFLNMLAAAGIFGVVVSLGVCALIWLWQSRRRVPNPAADEGGDRVKWYFQRTIGYVWLVSAINYIVIRYWGR